MGTFGGRRTARAAKIPVPGGFVGFHPSPYYRRVVCVCRVMARTYEPLARRLCKAVHDLSDVPPTKWVPVKEAATVINVSYPELIDGAVTHARQRGWLEAVGKPAVRLRLTDAGRIVSSRAKPAYSHTF